MLLDLLRHLGVQGTGKLSSCCCCKSIKKYFHLNQGTNWQNGYQMLNKKGNPKKSRLQQQYLAAMSQRRISTKKTERLDFTMYYSTFKLIDR
jgi:hypothetical protein